MDATDYTYIIGCNSHDNNADDMISIDPDRNTFIRKTVGKSENHKSMRDNSIVPRQRLQHNAIRTLGLNLARAIKAANSIESATHSD